MADLAPAPLRLATTPLEPGALALAVGSRDGAALAAFGAVSLAGPAWRSLRGGDIDARLELDLRLPRRAEGGVAVDAAGRVFGMTVFGPRRRVLVIPAATIERVAAKLETHGRIARGYLGLGLQTVRIAQGESGVMVMSVDPDGPGKAADIRQGDIIVAGEGQPMRNVQMLIRTLGPDSPGTTVTLSLRRGGAPVEARITIGERARA